MGDGDPSDGPPSLRATRGYSVLPRDCSGRGGRWRCKHHDIPLQEDAQITCSYRSQGGGRGQSSSTRRRVDSGDGADADRQRNATHERSWRYRQGQILNASVDHGCDRPYSARSLTHPRSTHRSSLRIHRSREKRGPVVRFATGYLTGRRTSRTYGAQPGP